MEGWDPKVVVVGVDGSDQSIAAAHAAGALARCQSAKLIVVTVVRPPEGWWGIVAFDPLDGVVLSQGSQVAFQK